MSKDNIDLRTAFANLRRNFGVFVSLVPIVGGNVVGTLFDDLLADAAMCPQMRALDLDQRREILGFYPMVPREGYSIHLVLDTAINFINENDAIRFPLQVGSYAGVEKALFLEIICEILLALLHQIRIDCALGKNRE